MNAIEAKSLTENGLSELIKQTIGDVTKKITEEALLGKYYCIYVFDKNTTTTIFEYVKNDLKSMGYIVKRIDRGFQEDMNFLYSSVYNEFAIVIKWSSED